MKSINLSDRKRYPLEALREKFDGDTQDVAERSAKSVLIGGLKGFLILFGSFFGAIITSDAVQVDFIISLLLFAFMGMSALFLYFNRQDKKEIKILKEDQVIMARTQVGMVDTMENDFVSRLNQAMTNIEGNYSDTIIALSCQINDLVKATIEEKQKIHYLLNMMTTEDMNGVEQMTTEDIY